MPSSKSKQEKGSKEPSRNGSTDGGVALPGPPSTTAPTGTPNDAGQAQDIEPRNNSRRRRPRKLNRPPAEPSSSQAVTSAEPEPALPSGEKMETEIHELKKKVEDLETQVQTILEKQATETASKSSRRRLRREKSGLEKSSAKKEPEETDELKKLQEDLEEARTVLARSTVGEHDNNSKSKQNRDQLQNKAEKGERMAENADSDVEEIPRASIPGSEARPPQSKRTMTFSGSYKIPVPAAVSNEDLNAVKKGLKGVQNIAKKVIAEAREQPGAHNELQRTQSGSGWSSWLGGYSLSVARFVNKIELEPAGEKQDDQTQRPNTQKSRTITEPPRRRPPKLRVKKGPQDASGVSLDSEHAASLLK